MTWWLHPDAALEHEAQVAWYEARQTGLGRSYHNAFLSAVAMIVADPTRFKVVHKADIRKLRLRGFPFDLIYRQAGLAVQILAVAHHRRRPGHWTDRR